MDATCAAYPLNGRVGMRPANSLLALPAMRRSLFWLQRGWSTAGFTLEKNPYSDGCDWCQAVSGMRSTKVIAMIDLMLLKPYFHGTTSRSGAPFCCGRDLPYRPVARNVSGCMASSMRRPSRYGQSNTGERTPGICRGSARLVKVTYFAFEVGWKRFSTSASGTPNHGITIDQPSTQRIRYTRSSAFRPFSRSSSDSLPGFAHWPPTATVHGVVRRVLAAFDGSSLLVPNS